ncbi:hypothetical protein [Dermabacter hominis]|uniref:hypothetical protein n=1 Tax=Dermabacter hominis TaxID=36740 RepID=UPI002A4C0BDB|nr:hypothetical protein [Dermabacter hominis]
MDTSKLKNVSKQQKMIGCGGCLAVALVLFVIFWIIGTVAGPSEPEKEAKATTTTQAPATEKAEPAKEAKPTEKPKPKPSENPKPKPTEAPKPTEEAKPTEAPKPEKPAEKKKAEKPNPSEWAKQVEKDALMGASDWSEVCGGDYSRGVCWISDVDATTEGQLKVTLQLNGSDAESEALAEAAINYIFASAGPGHEELDWVIAQDASGTVIMQKSRSDMKAL